MSDVDVEKLNKEYDADLKKTAYQEFWEDLKTSKKPGSRGSASAMRPGRTLQPMDDPHFHMPSTPGNHRDKSKLPANGSILPSIEEARL